MIVTPCFLYVGAYGLVRVWGGMGAWHSSHPVTRKPERFVILDMDTGATSARTRRAEFFRPCIDVEESWLNR